jgi:hypothetical protein
MKEKAKHKRKGIGKDWFLGPIENSDDGSRAAAAPLKPMGFRLEMVVVGGLESL